MPVLFFDWDNTLVDTWDLVHESMQVALRGLGEEEWSEQETRQRLGTSLRENFPRLFGERAGLARTLYRTHFLSCHLERLRPFATSLELLNALYPYSSAQNGGFAMGVISNKNGEALRAEVAHLGWQKYFSVVIGAEDCTSDKPDPACMLEALSRLQKSESRLASGAGSVIYVGDSEIDMEFAHRCNAIGILLQQGREDSHTSPYPPTHLVHDLNELGSLLARLLSITL